MPISRTKGQREEKLVLVGGAREERRAESEDLYRNTKPGARSSREKEGREKDENPADRREKIVLRPKGKREIARKGLPRPTKNRKRPDVR